MAKRKNSLLMYEPTSQEQLDYSMRNAIEKAVLNHPETIKLRKVIEKEMKKAAKVAPTKIKKK